MAYSYFSFFPNVTIGNTVIKDIFNSININNIFLNNPDYFDIYHVKDGEHIEDLADRWYSDKSLFWIIMIVNEYKDILYDYPLQQKDLSNLAQKIFDEQDPITLTYDQIFQQLYEDNEIKKDIKYLKPQYLDKFIYLMITR
jgi:hypothetical protein